MTTNGSSDVASSKVAAGASPPSVARYPHMDFPVLTSQHVRNARLFCDRAEMLLALEVTPGAIIGEVGVALGGFSAFLLEYLKPAEFVAFDLFNLHTLPELWEQQTSVLFEGRTHLEYYRDRFAGAASRVVIEEGCSHETLKRYADGHFDILYIDASHTYQDVKADAAIAKHKIKENGLLVFNDYIMWDHLSGGAYGVVPAVNELLVQENWEVVGFALQQHMFCDIAIRRLIS
jgi:hypothetical protein